MRLPAPLDVVRHGLGRLLRRTAQLPPVLVAALLAGTLVAATAVAATGLSGHTARPHGLQAAGATLPVGGGAVTAPGPQGTFSSTAAAGRPPALHTADLLVDEPGRLAAATLQAIRSLPGVVDTELTDYGRLLVDGHQAYVLGVDPAGFRAYTPRLSAESDGLWQRVVAGEIAVSFDLGNGAGLPLGGTVPVTGRRTVPMRIGAFASTGLPGIDAIVSDAQARAVGLPAGNAVIVSAPNANPYTLRNSLAALVGATQVQVLRRVVVIRDAGEFLTRAQIDAIIRAAASRIGVPYVYAATGPNSFDCSGLTGWAFAHAGIRLPRTAAQQFLAGPHVPLADARPGDLLFWTYDPTDPTFVDHVALYVGNGMEIMAPHTGLDVEMVPIRLPHLAGVVRVDPAMAAEVGAPWFPGPIWPVPTS